MPDVYEQLESRKITSSGGRTTATRTFMMSGYQTLRSITATFGTDVGGTPVPGVGAAHPEYGGLVARDFTIDPVGGHNDLYSLTWTYEQVSTDYFTSPTFNIEILPNEVDYVELSSEIRAEFAPTYRIDVDGSLTVPPLGKPGEPDYGDPFDPDNDIAGKPVDAAGNPTSQIRRIQELTLTEIVNEPAFTTYQTFRFTRNSKTFQGAAPGHVLYRGCSVRRTGLNVYTVSHQFIYDELFHLQQQPRVDQDGRPILNAAGTHANQVYFIQPFPKLLDHNAISTNF